ncbi:uncharacterized protein EV420DRAFT_993393 [Desarmillaria tabescens]|uniref:REJ domain-containing protein n=1 Tax=Armillaria tabescens TaxID=1929756 RepID=A0AA39JMI1_ARMTA|nr:uncharacterized protein EV420DRAFT_993393 [Desarmillaria tabescens]KAK0444600.1 hypothetical protein EV420DRAFT_993393 [Desarmillaria tabescens]
MAPRSFQHLSIIFCYLLATSSESALASPLRIRDDPNTTNDIALSSLISSFYSALSSISPEPSASIEAVDMISSIQSASAIAVTPTPAQAISAAETQYSQTTSDSQDDPQTPSPTPIPTSDAQAEDPTSLSLTESPVQDSTEDAFSTPIASPSTSSDLEESYAESSSLAATQDVASSTDAQPSSSTVPTPTSQRKFGPGPVIIATPTEQQVDFGTTTAPAATPDISSQVPVGPSHTKTPQTPKQYPVPVGQLLLIGSVFFGFIALTLLIYFVVNRPSAKKWLNEIRGIKEGKGVRWDLADRDSLAEEKEENRRQSSFSFSVTPPTPAVPPTAQLAPTAKSPWLTLPSQTIPRPDTARSSLGVADINGGLSGSRWSAYSSACTSSARSSCSSGSWYGDDESVPEVRKSVPLLSPEVFFTLPSEYSESGNSRRSSAPIDYRFSKIVGKDEGGRRRSNSVGVLAGLS